MIEAIHILSPGPCTTVQDLGRYGALHLGVPPSGMVDDYAGRVANWLVGNPTDYAVLEVTLLGIELLFLCDADIAITGAAMQPLLNATPCRQWTSLRVQAGDILRLLPAVNGCRAYIAITGGISVPQVLGSRSTGLGAGLGGLQGRKLMSGDVLRRGPGHLLPSEKSLPWFPLYPEVVTLRTVPGPHDEYFTQAVTRFFNDDYHVTNDCDRMGVRLQGPPLQRDAGAPASILSQPVVAGTIQIPSDGNPIILLREQTIGGYTSIATVISPDIWRIGQAKPGDTIRFSCVTLEEGQEIYRDWTTFLKMVETLLQGQ